MTAAEAEAYLASLEPIGWKLGLDRIRGLTAVMGMPQHRFASIHVVGTNGKTSVALMVEALLEAHGVRAGAYVSPHIGSWAERIRIGGERIPDADFAAAIERAAQSAGVVNRTLGEGEAVTQFELFTAAAFYALAAAGVEAAAVEAGLGGRLDATNVIPSRVSALTSIGLDHTEWLGDSEERIAAEKLDVLRDHSTLVLGRVSGPVAALAARIAADRSAALVPAPEDPGPEIRLRSAGRYQRRNLALAIAAVEALLGRLDRGAARSVAARLLIPGRTQLIDGEVPLILDAAHNPDGVRAVVEALPELAGGRAVIACLAVLEGKDARSMAAALAPACAAIVCTEVPQEAIRGSGRPGGSSLPAAELAVLCEAAGAAEVEALPDAEAALDRAAELAAAGGVALVTGSHYLLGLVAPPARPAKTT